MSISREVLAKYIKPGCVFIETGTKWGDTCIRAIELGAKQCWTCESDLLMAGIAQAHTDDATRGAVIVVRMDSDAFLKNAFHDIADTADWYTSTIVFLDAHSETSSPVLKELDVISSWRVKPNIILIDDMRCMAGWGVDILVMTKRLIDMGYILSREDGVTPGDILVARL